MTTQNGSLTLQRGKITRPQKAVIYGPEGVGKSTFASLTPAPVYLDTEGGTHHLDVIRLDAVSSWDEITAAVAQLAKAEHPFKSLIIDTADWLEKRLAEHLCRKANKDSIEDFGYGKGWVLLTEEFARFLNSLDALLARGMNVVFLAHSTVKKFEAPDQAGSYDRFELKLSKQVAPLLKEWADVVLFANYVTRIAEKDSGKTRGVGGKERVLYATHTAAYDAKNRHGLPDK
ncbi:MAG: ATP-binding protein, partial [Verrucomicrobiota bacterium]